MLNPEIHSSMITPRTMFSYDRGTNKTWNMQEYHTPKIYQDPKLEIQKRKWAVQQKGKKTDKYVTKRGFYMDYHVKVSKSVPASSKNGSQEPWTFKKQEKLAEFIKRDPNLKKNTYLQQIQNEQEKRKVPGVSTYHLQKTQKQKQALLDLLKRKVIKKGEKRYFYENTELLSEEVPGPGFYCPHDDVEHLKKNNSDYDFWVKKHKKENDFIRKRQMKKPSANSYKPIFQSFDSFQLTQRMLDISPRKSLEKTNWFGSDAKFEYTRPDKKKIKEVRPSPASYNTGINWKGKQDPKKKKKKGWSEIIWKGPQNKSIYNETS